MLVGVLRPYRSCTVSQGCAQTPACGVLVPTSDQLGSTSQTLARERTYIMSKQLGPRLDFTRTAVGLFNKTVADLQQCGHSLVGNLWWLPFLLDGCVLFGNVTRHCALVAIQQLSDVGH